MEKTVKKKTSSVKRNTELEKTLIENFVALQKVMTHLSEKFDSLTKQTSELLKLFEDSAKTVIRRDFQPLPEKQIKLDTKEMESKLDNLLEQNKIIAKGLTLIHDTAKNPEIDYSIGKTTPPVREMIPKESIMPKKEIPMPNNSKKRVEEQPRVPRI